jgi:hypothetical protein
MSRCADCGYLTVRNRVDNSLGEAAIDYREKGAVAMGIDDKGMNLHSLQERLPLCFARQSYLENATSNIKPRDNPVQEVVAIIQRDIQCAEFTTWRQGFTPKEHREMIDRQFMMKMEEEHRKNDRKWHWIELVAIILGTGLFTLLGAWIATH